MTAVYVTSEQPFRSRVGVDEVLLLRFRFDAALITLLKRVLLDHRAEAVPWKSCGGWLATHWAWFCERSCWASVRHELEAAGYRVEYVAAACR
jgi:hypothetical protein